MRMRTFSAADAARECGVSRPTITRAAAAGRIAGAVRDDAGAWALPLDGLLAAGFHPGRPSPPEDQQRAKGDAVDRDRVHELELAVLRAEVREQRIRADGLERERDLYRLMLEQGKPPHAPLVASQSDEQPQSDPIPTPVYAEPPRANVGKWKRAWNVLWHG